MCYPGFSIEAKIPNSLMEKEEPASFPLLLEVPREIKSRLDWWRKMHLVFMKSLANALMESHVEAIQNSSEQVEERQSDVLGLEKKEQSRRYLLLAVTIYHDPFWAVKFLQLNSPLTFQPIHTAKSTHR